LSSGALRAAKISAFATSAAVDAPFAASNFAIHQKTGLPKFLYETNRFVGITTIERNLYKQFLILERLQLIDQLPNGFSSDDPIGLRCQSRAHINLQCGSS
jgi:hypothetical protein